jgi:hypothetical protein
VITDVSHFIRILLKIFQEALDVSTKESCCVAPGTKMWCAQSMVKMAEAELGNIGKEKVEAFDILD